MIGSEDERVNQDVGTPRRESGSAIWTALGLFQSMANSGERQMPGDRTEEVMLRARDEIDRLRGIEAAARVLTAYLPTNPTEGHLAALTALREALGELR